MSHRYFVIPPIEGDLVVLAGPEAHHLIHVMRAQVGATVTLFDGTGAEFTARLEAVRRAKVELAVLSREMVDRELPLDLTLGVALPKGDRRKWLIEKVVELGVTRVVPLETSRSEGHVGRQVAERLKRSVVEASKQCGRNRLMEICEPAAWGDFLAATGEIGFRLLAHPAGGQVDADRFVAAEPFEGLRAGDSVSLAVGPEGGFTCEEVAAAAEAGWQVVELGRRTLRVETAAIVLTAIVVRGMA